jgi:hypothetical protein
MSPPRVLHDGADKRGWALLLAGLLVGGVIGSATAEGGNPDPQAASDTSIIFRDLKQEIET